MRESWIILAVVTMALGLSAIVQAANGATVTKATLASGFCDTTGCYAATCNETQVVNENQRKETFDCTFDAARPAPFVCDTSVGCGWFSDFDGAEASNTHFVITPFGPHGGLGDVLATVRTPERLPESDASPRREREVLRLPLARLDVLWPVHPAMSIQLCTTRTRKLFLRARPARMFARSCDR